MDNGLSKTSKFLKTNLIQFLGRISMAVYLVHVPLITTFRLLIYGPMEFAPGNYNKLPFPYWAVIAHIFVTIGIASLLTFYFEEPIRKVLNKVFYM